MRLLSKEKSEISRLQNTLARLGPNVMGIRLLLGDEHAYAIVVTAQARKKFELACHASGVARQSAPGAGRSAPPVSNPKPHLAELYAMTVAPLEDELNALERSAREKDLRAHAAMVAWTA